MKVKSFLGGQDVQNSLNLADNKCINLYPVQSDDGTVKAFYKTDGLKSEGTFAGIPTGAYKTSTGRSFYVTGTTLYELSTALVSTSRGTVSAGEFSFSDNGLELILVNGISGWILTLSTNVLTQIKVSTGTATVSIATPAVITRAAHGFVAGDRFLLFTTGALPTGVSISTLYYVIAAGLTSSEFEFSETLGGTAVNTSGSTSGVHTLNSAGYGFPETCTSISYMNGRFIAVEPDTQNFYVSDVLDGGYWDALDVQTVDSNPDFVTGQTVSHNELIVFCETSAEVFVDSGTTPTPFVRHLSGIFEVGCNAPLSIANIDNSVIWLGKTKEGKGVVYKLNGYTPTRISTDGIESQIKDISTTTNARAFAYQNGHNFYCLTFPSGGKTFVYDLNTQLWHERASFISSIYGRWEPNHYLNFAMKHLVTDFNSTTIWSLDRDTYTNGSNPNKIVRSFRSPPSDMKRITHHALEIEAEFGTGLINGTDSTIMLRWSDDGGHTWSAERTKSLGLIGETSKQVIFRRLGITKGAPRIYEISCTESVQIVLISVYLT